MQKRKLEIVRTADNELPKYAHEGDAGMDLRAAEMTSILPGKSELVRTGVKAKIPKGCVGLVFPRSGLGSKGITLRNAVGVIDSGYRGEVMAALWNTTEDTAIIPKGHRVCQLVVVPYVPCEVVEVEELDETERGEDGHGSTGVE